MYTIYVYYGLEIPDKPGQGEGGVVCQKPDVRKIQKSEKQIQKLFDNVQLYQCCIHMYLSTVFTNLQMSGDSQRLLGDYLREYLREISWNLGQLSWNLEICGNGREIL